MSNQEYEKASTPSPNQIVLVDAQYREDSSPGALAQAGIPPNPWGSITPQSVRHYEGIWLSNPLKGAVFIPRSSQQDFSEFYVAMAIAQQWTADLKVQLEFDAPDLELIQQTRRLSELIILLGHAANQPESPKHPQNPNYRINLN